jgi:uncharacterized damage-inducible protein DinB
LNTCKQIAKHLREVFFGGNWTWSNLQDQLAGVALEKAIEKKDGGFHSIAELSFHIYYFVKAILNVFEGKPLSSKDSESFDLPPVLSQGDWEKLKGEIFGM